MEGEPVRIEDLISFVARQQPEGDALDLLSEAVLVGEQLGELSDQLIGHFVSAARKSGASWTDIGRNIGVSKQAAQKRFVARSSDEPALTPARAFSRFTDRAKHVVLAAQEEARRARHAEVGTEHLLLGFLHEPKCLAVKAIESFGITRDALIEAVEPCLGAPQSEVPGHIPFTRHAKKVRNLALREALRMGHNYIGTEHMLLAMLRDEKSLGGKILSDLGVTWKGAAEWTVDAVGKLRS
jgi:Clp amino terminal domain, pathogenicity island component